MNRFSYSITLQDSLSSWQSSLG